ncbi:single-stranded DNA-binding protein [Flavobacterium psychroterrae]|uniref:Single-stranded DNA-binding protein n=1 Tax=Flavobacterium psychroterrae TaxID=2133767 RepID=A0ABS5PIY5_9FLAO|nr:single-stranded DNA-binding protein [Flavobacterium psychroterrae]MBS7234273.1 single-stranded DNA-binding protein [Flavobacterium psychroterrae]
MVQKRDEGKEVVNFSIAINDRYKPKGSAEYKEVATFINCSYWLSSKVVQWIKKGAFVQVTGRIGMHVYINNEGNPVGSLDFHVDSIKILVFAKKAISAEKRNSKRAAKGRKEKVTEDVSF